MKKSKVNSQLEKHEEFATCKVIDIGLSGFAECEQRGPVDCSYAVPFGYCFLCHHPRIDEIMGKTKELNKVHM